VELAHQSEEQLRVRQILKRDFVRFAAKLPRRGGLWSAALYRRFVWAAKAVRKRRTPKPACGPSLLPRQFSRKAAFVSIFPRFLPLAAPEADDALLLVALHGERRLIVPSVSSKKPSTFRHADCYSLPQLVELGSDPFFRFLFLI
jgi:hypothetical protein